MEYPLSAEVLAGQPTASAHYNTLRNDALYLGKDALNAAPLGQLLAHYEDGLQLELLDTDRVRVPASAAEQVCLVIDGYMLGANANVDLPAGSRPNGGAAQYYVFAVRSPGSITFTLDVNTTITESANRRRIGRFWWDGSRIDAASLAVERRGALMSALGLVGLPVFGGRLTLASGSPTADAASGGTIFYTPYVSNRVSVYAPGFGWRVFPFSELSKSLEGMPANRPVDVFLANIAGALTLELEPWTSSSIRSAELTLQDGIEVKSSAPTRVYLGSLGITASGSISADSPEQRLVWNRHNRIARPMASGISVSNWTYATTAYRPVNGSGEVKLETVTGLETDGISIQAGLLMKSAEAYTGGIGIGLDTTSTNSAQVRIPHLHNGIGPALAFYTGKTPAGLHTWHMLEWGNSGITFYGSNGAGTVIRSGMTALVMA